MCVAVSSRVASSVIVRLAMLLLWLGLSNGAAGQEPRPAVPLDDIIQSMLTPNTGHEVPCEGGKAEIFDCRSVDLLAFLPPTALGSSKERVPEILNDMWGWTDPGSGREFAILCLRYATAFVEVTDPVNPRYLGALPVRSSQNGRSIDVKVYKHYAYVSSSGSGGLQVFDLTRLLSVTDTPTQFQETVHYDGVGGAHNLVLNEETGFLYMVGGIRSGETCGGGLHMIDLHNPIQPTFAGCYAETFKGERASGYIHDAQCVVYRGPDRQYRGREICLNSAEKAFTIVDVTDKQRPRLISLTTYPNVGYTHQGWLTENQRYFFLGDESDEHHMPRDARRTRTLILDLSDLDDPIVAKEFFFDTTSAIDHNLYIRGHYVYEANYRAGLRILDIRDPLAPKEVGYFDTTPAVSQYGTDIWFTGGAWTGYPYFKNNVVGISSLSEGFFLVRFRPPQEMP